MKMPTTGQSPTLVIRNATASNHKRLESLLGLAADDLSLARYGMVLQAFVAVYGFLEPRLRLTVAGSLADVLDLPARTCKHEWLCFDLETLGLSHSLPVTHEGLEVESVEQALGVMYVLEGATLGGKYISAYARQHLSTTAVTFFSSYGKDVPRRWSEFRIILNKYFQLDPADLHVASQASIRTFALFESQYLLISNSTT